MGVDVRLATAADARGIGELYSRAFLDDPITSWVTPDRGRRARVLRRMNAAIARFEGVRIGATYVALDAGNLVGAAIWQPPGPWTWHAGSIPFGLTTGAALGRDIPRMVRMGRAVSRARPRLPHWYLQLLGVEPTVQHAGIGSALVRHHLERVDGAHLPAYLETTRENLEFYGRLGFEVTGEIVIEPLAPSEFSLFRRAR